MKADAVHGATYGVGVDSHEKTGLVPHIALRYEVKIRTYGALSTTIRKRFGWIHEEESSAPDVITVQQEEEESEFVKVRKRNWARLIRKVWIEDPELCQKCGSRLEVLSALSSPAQDDVIEKILRCRREWSPPWERARQPRGAAKQLEFFPDDGNQVPTWNPEDENQDPPGDAWME